MTPTEYLSFCGQISGMNASEREDRAKELLQLVGLSEEKRRIKGFSRGMKQRLGIAQALMNKPRLLICDEPTSALDPIGRKEILDILLSVREQTTVLFSTHVLTDVERICDRVAFLDNGVISASGTVEEIKGRFQRDEYRIEVLTEKDADILLEAFDDMKKPDARAVVFSEKDIPLHEVMTVLADKRIKVLRLERAEPTLEDLFTEVADK
jgi:ABC-2 type transport system ATP-binding protein